MFDCAILQDKSKTFLLRTKAVTPPCYIQESFTEEEQVVLEEEAEPDEHHAPLLVKIEGGVGAAADQDEDEVGEAVGEETTFLSENLFEGTLITKVFDEDEVFVNEVTIEDGGIKEEPLEISQE